MDPENEIAFRERLDGKARRFQILARSEIRTARRDARRSERQAQNFGGIGIKGPVADSPWTVRHLLNYGGGAEQMVFSCRGQIR